jgi:hypothetical protein
VRVIPRVPKFPLGPPYIAEEGIPPKLFVGPDGTIIQFEGVPPLVYTPLQPMQPPPFLPGDPIPPGMPPAWNGGTVSKPPRWGELRPPYPWEPLMLNPKWNPSEPFADMPTYVPNPPVGQGGTYDPNYPVPPGMRTPVARPGPAIPAPGTVPDVPPGNIGVTIPANRPEGFWPAIVGRVRIVLGVAGALGSLATLFVESDHFNATIDCLTRFLGAIGFDNGPSVTTNEAEDVVESLRYFALQNDQASLAGVVNDIVARGCDKAPGWVNDWKFSEECSAFAQNIVAAIKLCRCKKNPPDQTAAAAAKAALLLRISNYRDSDATMRAEMEGQKAQAQAAADAYGNDLGGNYSVFCRDKWLARVAAIDALILARTYVVGWFDLKKNMDGLDMPTCENRLSADAVLAYIAANNKAMDASVAAFQNAQDDWNGFKAANGDMKNIGCPVLVPTTT